MEFSLDNVDLAMKVQTTLQRRVLDYQAENILKLVESVTSQENKKAPGVKEEGKGTLVDLIA